MHSWLGHQLLKQDKPLYNLLYAEHGQQQPKAYALACHDHRTVFPEQGVLSFELTLFGSATQVADRLVQALATHPLGIGSQHLRVSLQSIASYPTGFALGDSFYAIGSLVVSRACQCVAGLRTATDQSFTRQAKRKDYQA